MEDSTNRFAVRATIQATSRMNTRFTVQKYLRKKSSITRPGRLLKGFEQAKCHRKRGLETGGLRPSTRNYSGKGLLPRLRGPWRWRRGQFVKAGWGRA